MIETYQQLYNQTHNQNTQKETESAEKFELADETAELLKNNEDVLVIDQNLKGIDFSLSKCCNPIYGDPIFGFVTVNGGIKIHREDCPNAPELRKRFGYRVVKSQMEWQRRGKLQHNAAHYRARRYWNSEQHYQCAVERREGCDAFHQH